MIANAKKIEIKNNLKEILDVQRQFLEMLSHHPDWIFLYDDYLDLDEIKKYYEILLTQEAL